MRRGFIAVAIVATFAICAACGGLLGLGEDDEPTAAPTSDASTESNAADASGVTQVDGSLVCETLTEDFAAFTESSQLPDAGWRRFFGSPACALLGFDAGALVVELPPGDPDAGSGEEAGAGCTASNAGVFRRFEGVVKTLDCSFDVTVSALDGNLGFFEYRVEQGTNYSTYRAIAGWDNDQGIQSRAQATPFDGGVELFDTRSSNRTPDAGAPFRVRAKLDARQAPATYTFWFPTDTGSPLVIEMPEAGAASFWELYVGVTGFGIPGKSVTIDNVTCESCRQP